MNQISTVVSSTYSTVLCPIRGLYSRLIIYDLCRVKNYPNRVLNKSCRRLAGAGGQWAKLRRKLRQTYLLTPLFAKVTWPYNPGSVESFPLLRLVSGHTTPVVAHPFFRSDGDTSHATRAHPFGVAHLGSSGLYDPSDPYLPAPLFPVLSHLP